MAGKRVFQIGGITAVGAGAYYLYSAGGDPKVAQKKIEHDAATATRKVKGEVPGRESEARKAGEEHFEAVRAKAQNFADDAKAEADRAGKSLDRLRQDAGAQFEDVRERAGNKVNNAANKFDKSVSDGANKSKSYFSGWFGSK